MAHGIRRFVPLLLAVLTLLLGIRGLVIAEVEEAIAGVSAAVPQSTVAVDRQINPDGFTSARVCGECHTDIYASWRTSLHAFSLSDPVFDAAFMQAVRVAGDGVREVCLNCHAPIARETGDFALRNSVTAEGITCDFCHTVTAVHMEEPYARYELDPGNVKRSVLRNASSPVHETAYSALHETAEFCGGCHNFVAATGARLMSTYEEWKNGPYAAEGIVCQNCHMALASGGPVDAAISDTHQEHHLHSLIHDSEQVRSAIDVEIVSVERDGDSLDVAVAIANVGSGHMVPTGMPTREMVLKVEVTGGTRDRFQERRYGRKIADADGNPLDSDYEILLHGAQVLNDNRIAPRERRVERMQFYAPQSSGGALKVTATVSYFYAPMIMDVRTMNIQMARAEKDVR